MRTRLATPDDARDIFEWRNDPLTREMSISVRTISWESHCNWLAMSLAKSDRLLLICEESAGEDITRKVAIVFFDVTGDSATTSINLAPQMRGRGLAPLCLEAAIIAFKTAFPQVQRLEAKIKTANHASQRSFARAGFQPSGAEGEMITYVCIPEQVNE